MKTRKEMIKVTFNGLKNELRDALKATWILIQDRVLFFFEDCKDFVKFYFFNRKEG